MDEKTGLTIDLDAPENSGGQWLAPQKRETAKHPPKDQPSEVPGEEIETAKAFDESKHPRDPGGEDGGQFVSGGGGVSDTSAKKPGSVQSIGQPKFIKSKNPHNEYGYTVTHNGRAYEVYRDASMMGGTWMSFDLLNKNNPGSPGVPADHIGHNKGDVVNEIMSGRLATRIDRVKAADAIEKIITDAGARHGGFKLVDNKLQARIVDPETRQWKDVPMESVTPESVETAIHEIRDRVKKSDQQGLVDAAATAAVKALAPTLEMLAKGQAEIVEGLNAETEQIPVRDENMRIKSVIKRRVRKAGVQPIPETKLPKGTGPTVAS